MACIPTITLVLVLSLLLSSVVQAQVPSNDECVNATIIPPTTTLPYVSPFVDAKFATNNVNDSVTNCSDIVTVSWLSIWYEWEPNAKGIYFFYNGDRNQSILIELFRGNDCGSLAQIGCDYGSSPLFEARLTANERYYIKVSTEPFSSNPVRFFVDAAIPPPQNTVCSEATIVEGGDTVFGSLNFSVFDIPSFSIDCYRFHSRDDKNPTLWYKVTNTMATPIAIIASTCNPMTTSNTVITVFEGNTGCTDLKCVGGDDNPFIAIDPDRNCYYVSAKYGFLAAPSTTYYIAVELAYFDEYQNFTMSIETKSNYFGLIDATSDERIGIVQADMEYSQIVSSNLNIEAVFEDSIGVQSVLVTYDNDPAYTRCERKPPFSVFKDKNGNFFDGTITVGVHNITANAYSQQGCTGEIASTLAQRFYIAQCDYFITAWKVSQNTTIARTSLFNTYLDVNSFPCDDVNIEVIFDCGFDIEEVELTLRNIVDKTLVLHSRTERFTPYYLFGNKGTVVNRGTINAARYFLDIILNGVALLPTAIIVNNNCTSA